jgi:peptidoglycan/LPS O-acetylase OafA/YrhL
MDQKQEITDLTICRAGFAGWVFIYHVDLYVNFSAWLGPFAGLVRRGYLGVDGFFILSGMILARVHPELYLSSSGTLKFLARRIARIYPVHLATILIFAAIFIAGLAAGMTPRDAGRFDLASLLQNLLLVQGWGWADQGAWNYPSWSISAEWAGYLLFPLFLRLAWYFDWYVSMQFVIAAFMVIGLLIARDHYSLNLTFGHGLFRFFPEFIMGLSTARFVPNWADAAPSRAFVAAGLLIVLFGASEGIDFASLLGLWFILTGFMMQFDAQRPPVLGRRVILRRLGLLSYAFYMSFAISELLLTRAFRVLGWVPAAHGIAFALGMLLVTLVLSVLLHVAVEIPARRAGDAWLDRLPWFNKHAANRLVVGATRDPH